MPTLVSEYIVLIRCHTSTDDCIHELSKYVRVKEILSPLTSGQELLQWIHGGYLPSAMAGR